MRTLSEDQLAESLKKAERDLEEIKTRQFTGADNLQVITNQSGSSFDKSASLSAGAQANITITFDADSQDYSFTDAIFYVYKDSTSPGDLLTKVKPNENFGDYFGNVSIFGLSLREVVSSSSTPKRTQWNLKFSSAYSGTHTFYVKAYILSSDTGTIS